MIAHLSSVFGSKWLEDRPPSLLLVPGRSNEINWWPGGGPGGLGAIGHFPAVFRWERIYFPVPPLLPQHILAVNRCTSKRESLWQQNQLHIFFIISNAVNEYGWKWTLTNVTYKNIKYQINRQLVDLISAEIPQQSNISSLATGLPPPLSGWQ